MYFHCVCVRMRGARWRSAWARGGGALGCAVARGFQPQRCRAPPKFPFPALGRPSRFPALGNNFVSVSRSRYLRRSVCLFTERVSERRKRRKPPEKHRFLKNRRNNAPTIAPVALFRRFLKNWRFSVGLAAFSARWHTLRKQQKFRSTQIFGQETEEKMCKRTGTLDGARRRRGFRARLERATQQGSAGHAEITHKCKHDTC